MSDDSLSLRSTVLEYPVLDEIEVRISFNVKGKGRPRFDSRSGHAYMSKDYVQNKDNVSWLLREATMDKPGFFSATHMFQVRALQFRKVPKPRSKKQAAEFEIEKPYGGFAPAGGIADIDNMIGTLLDAAHGIIYADDKQVVSSCEDRIWMDRPGAIWIIRKLGVWNATNTLSASSKVAKPWYFMF